MTIAPPQERPEIRLDLTRWNRAGLKRFRYVDGDAATWLEELRIALLGLYARGLDPEKRTPEAWRDLFMQAASEWPVAADRDAALDALAWKTLFAAFPAQPETAGKRNARLLAQYDIRSPDYAWEIMRAFARAGHVLLDHLDAYANEGYLRTATQRDNVRKLAAMVNYQPAPAASAVTAIALILDPAKGGAEIDRGLAMKFAPPEGGAPLIFETLAPIDAHPDLNGARAEGWNYNTTPLAFSAATHWLAPPKAKLTPGDLVVLTTTDSMAGEALALKSIVRDEENERAELVFDPTPSTAYETGAAELWIEPADAKAGLPRSSATGGVLVIAVDAAASYQTGAVVRVTHGGSSFLATVTAGKDGFLTLNTTEAPTGVVTVEAFSPFDLGAQGYETTLDVSTLHFRNASGAVLTVPSSGTRKWEDPDNDASEDIARSFQPPIDAIGPGYASLAGSKSDNGRVVSDPPVVIPGLPAEPANTVQFAGDPPKAMNVGDWFAARATDTGTMKALRVVGVRKESSSHYVQFHTTPPADPDKTVFFGPLMRTLRPVDHDRRMNEAVAGGIAFLEGLSPEAGALLKPGRRLVVDYTKDDVHLAGLATLTAVEPAGDAMKVFFDAEQSFAGLEAGWTEFRLNIVDVSHGETKGPKTLGSGDAERERQNFKLNVAGISFVPSNAAASGVAPDIDVTVDGVKWEYRDYGDPAAEGAEAFSVTVNDDDTLQVRFRRRLPTGTNNVSVSRHRIGVGLKGSGVPPWSFAKPMKKHRYVTDLIQPFATAGGAEREPVSAVRVNAPSRLAANDRAISLPDFERLCRRHASVWQAKARAVIAPGPANVVGLTIVPAGGGAVTETLKRDLADFVLARALPNTRVVIDGYVAVPVRIVAKVFVDIARYEKTDAMAASLATLVATFGLERRALGQPLYVAEILAALETVESVSSAVIVDFARRTDAPAPAREAMIGGGLAAIFPADGQVVLVESAADVAVTAEAAA